MIEYGSIPSPDLIQEAEAPGFLDNLRTLGNNLKSGFEDLTDNLRNTRRIAVAGVAGSLAVLGGGISARVAEASTIIAPAFNTQPFNLATLASAGESVQTPNMLSMDIIRYNEQNVLVGNASGNIFPPSFPQEIIVNPHSATETASCKVVKPNYDTLWTNQYSYLTVNREYLKNISCRNGDQQPIVDKQPMKGVRGLCYDSSPYIRDCLKLDFEPGIIEVGDKAASFAGLQPSQYGDAYKLIFDKGVFNKHGQQFMQAIIDYKKATSSNTRQLKELIINVSNKGGVRKVSHQQLWF
jgi:hypothetical protein